MVYKKLNETSIKKLLILLIILNFSLANAKPVPESFADLAEKLMPSVVNISTTQTVRTTTNQFPFQFPPGSPFGEMFKDFERPTERKASSLGSGFVIDENGIVITNNHVVANAEDIFVRVGEKEYEAKVIGADPYMDIAVIKIKQMINLNLYLLVTLVKQELEIGLWQLETLLV